MALKRDLMKATVQNPGSRGGKFWRDEKGVIHYGEKPVEDKIQERAKSILDQVKRRARGKGGEIALSKQDLEKLLASGKYALVSAGPNPNHADDKNLSQDEIKRRHKQLGEDLVDAGYMFTNVTGHYGGTEDSYLVMIHDADRKDVDELGKKYHQDSIIYGEAGHQEMRFTFGEHVGTMHTGTGYEIKNDADDFFTIVRHPDGSSTKFALNFDWDKREIAKALKLLFKAEKPEEKKPAKDEKGAGFNESMGEQPVDAPVGFGPRIVKLPMHPNADVNPKVHEAKMEEKKQREKSQPKLALKKGAGWNDKDERMYQHIKDSGASEKIAAATVNKQRRKEGRVKKSKPSVTLIKGVRPGAKGAGSRGGKIAYHTKSGKPVYQSQVKKQAPTFSQMGHNWTKHAENAEKKIADYKADPNSNNPSHYRSYVGEAAGNHATAAKQHLVAAFYQHHAGDSDKAKEHMAAAEHHAEHAKKHMETSAKHKGDYGVKHHHQTAVRAMKWFDANHASTHEAVHYGRHPDPHIESIAQDAQDSGRHEEAKRIRHSQDDVKKALTPSNNNGGNMSKNEVADLFKSELGESNAKPITTCVHCKHDLTRDDLKKGLGTHFVADDNDNPHSGGDGSVEVVRGVPGAKENDEIAPLLKGLKGKEAGDNEEYPISKSEMATMGMSVDGLDDGWYTITKSEMQKQAPEHLAYLVDRKERVAKAIKPTVNALKKGEEPIRKGDTSRSTTDGPHGYSPRAGGVVGPSGESLVQWSEGSDKQVAEYIEKSGHGYGPGNDEPIRTQGRGTF